MKRLFFIILIAFLLAAPVDAVDLEAPPVPDSGRDLMPYESESFVEGAWSIICAAIKKARPDLADGIRVAGGLIGISLLLSTAKVIPGNREKVSELVGILSKTQEA